MSHRRLPADVGGFVAGEARFCYSALSRSPPTLPPRAARLGNTGFAAVLCEEAQGPWSGD
jgi:hypothetical protein